MRKVIPFILVFFTKVGFGQIALEHIYSEGSVTRVVLERSGEKYYLTDLVNKQLKIYNPNHTIWKTINLPVPAGANLLSVNNLSENKINPDNLLEFDYSYSSFGGGGVSFETRVVNENGTTLLVVEGVSAIVSEIPGLPNKLIISNFGLSLTSRVYSLPDLRLENSYINGYAIRTKLENSGEKYYVTNQSTNQLIIYNANHTVWKTINLTVPPTYRLTFSSQISETSINPDNSIEVIYSYGTAIGARSVESSIIKEDGTVILKVPNANSIFPINYPGLSNKLIATIESPVGGSSSSNIYSVPDLRLEKTYSEGTAARVVLERSGEKYCLTDTTTKQLKIYNANHTIWKTINLPTPPGARLSNVFQVSENKINNDNLIEFIYTYNVAGGAGRIFESRLLNEGGTLLLTVPDASSLFLSELPGLPNKLISLSSTATSSSSRVFSLPTSTVSSLEDLDKNNNVKIFPNPTSNLLFIETGSNTQVERIIIHNLDGKCIMELPFPNNRTINVSNLHKGIYFIKGYDNNDVIFQSKFMVN